MKIYINMLNQLQKDAKVIEKAINYTFQNKELLIEAFIDSSFPLNYLTEDQYKNNDNLMWRGNYLLQHLIADYLQANHHTLNKDEATKMLNAMINLNSCAKYADKLKVFDYYLYQVQQSQLTLEGDKPFKSTCIKALLSAFYIDSGKDFYKLTDFFLKNFEDSLEDVSDTPNQNYKSLLNEYTQQNHLGMPVFVMIEKSGQDHAPTFNMQVTIDEEVMGFGVSNSKKEAEQIAAKQAYEKLFEE